jgi:signal transduction histidine kinase
LPVAERQQYLEVAVRQIRRVARLSQQLFELARLECEETLPQPEVFSLSELLQDIAQKFALAASDKGVRLRHDARPEGFFVRGDIGMIERVIANLIENAIRHTPAGGEIRLDAVRAEGGIEILVTDTGVGIAAADLPDLFKRDSPLRQTSRRAGGGLGLQIARRILALHGTQMRVASEPGRGTTFRFALSPAPPG